jgi:hypothetical protein
MTGAFWIGGWERTPLWLRLLGKPPQRRFYMWRDWCARLLYGTDGYWEYTQ